MTPDEYEARLVDRLEASATAYPGWWDDDTPPRIALDAYADWLRLRAVAESVSPARGGVPVCDCAGHTAQRRMAEILAAAEVTA